MHNFLTGAKTGHYDHCKGHVSPTNTHSPPEDRPGGANRVPPTHWILLYYLGTTAAVVVGGGGVSRWFRLRDMVHQRQFIVSVWLGWAHVRVAFYSNRSLRKGHLGIPHKTIPCLPASASGASWMPNWREKTIYSTNPAAALASVPAGQRTTVECILWWYRSEWHCFVAWVVVFGAMQLVINRIGTN